MLFVVPVQATASAVHEAVQLAATALGVRWSHSSMRDGAVSLEVTGGLGEFPPALAVRVGHRPSESDLVKAAVRDTIEAFGLTWAELWDEGGAVFVSGLADDTAVPLTPVGWGCLG